MRKKASSGMGPVITTLGDESLAIHPEMIDTDQGKQPFLQGASLEEGCSGHRRIDTMFENTSEAYVENPREGSTPSPVCLVRGMYPQRSL